MLCFRDGWPDLGPQLSSPQTVAPNTPPPFRPPCATCLTSSTPRQQHTICSPPGWWKVSIATSRTCSGPGTAANWIDHLPWVLLGLCSAAREDNNTSPAKAVFGSPLIFPGQIFNSPELPLEQFLEQFSRTLSAAKYPHTRHNTATARCCRSYQTPRPTNR